MEAWSVRNQHERDKFVEFIDKQLAAGNETRFAMFRPETRTEKQNRALWLACQQLGDALNDAGFDLRSFPFKEGVDIPWDKELVKKRLFDPIMKAKTDKKSSRKLTKKQVSEIWDILQRHIGQSTGVTVPFPSWEHIYAQARAPKGYATVVQEVQSEV